MKSSVLVPMYFSLEIIGILEYAFWHSSSQFFDQNRSSVLNATYFQKKEFKEVEVITVTIFVFKRDITGNIVACIGVDYMTSAGSLGRTSDQIKGPGSFTIIF